MEREFVITNEHGIHARPATKLVQKANEFKSDISLTYDAKTVDLKSIMGVLSLGVVRGSLILIQVQGEDEVIAMRQISDMISDLNK